MAFNKKHYKNCKILLEADAKLGHKATNRMLQEANEREDYEASKAITEQLENTVKICLRSNK